nr:Gfo/Idh/MocA family oxidoreductase [Clostridia bacterium]
MNIGLLGYGFMGKTHSYAIHNMAYYYKELPYSASITAVCTSRPETAQAAARDFGFARAVTNEDELIYDPTIDIIDICTPNIYHYETLKKAIAAGKHIYCEKPLCINARQAAEIAALARDKGITAQIVFNYRFMSPMLRAKQLIGEGRLGRIVSFRSSYLHSSATDLTRKAGWKQSKEICGGGVLFDLGSHALDLVYNLCGEFKSVTGRSQIAYPERPGVDGKPWKTDADEAFYMIAELKNGAIGTVEASKITVGTNDDLTLEVYGEKGALKFSLMDPNWLYFYDNTEPTGELGGERGFKRIECVGRYPEPGNVFPSVKAPIGWLRGHVESYHTFLDCVYNGTPTSPSFDDAAHIQWVMEQAYKSDGRII